jgi:hypothetical protein
MINLAPVRFLPRVNNRARILYSGHAGWFGILLVLFLALIHAPQAGGYVLEGPHALSLMVKALSGPKNLRVDQRVIIEDPGVSEQPLELTESLILQFPDRFRSDAWYQTTHRILLVSGDRQLVVIDKRITADEEGRFDRYKNLLLYHSRKLLIKALLTDGIDVGRSSLGRFDNRIVIIIGAQYPDESVNQVWLDKERFLPLRWISYGGANKTGSDDDRLEFVYRNWQKWDDVWWPSQIESYHRQQLVRQIRTRHVEADITLPSQVMSIAHLKSRYQQAEPLQIPEPKKSETEEVLETIDEFRRKFEN